MQFPRDTKGRLHPKFIGVVTGVVSGVVTQLGGMLLIPRIPSMAGGWWSSHLSLVAVMVTVWMTMGAYLAVSYGRSRHDRQRPR